MIRQRIEWVDSLKAIAIFFIVLGHALNGVGIWKWLYGFHVPLFVALSGIVFNAEKKDELYIFLKKSASRLLIPYFLFSVISIFIYLFMNRFLCFEGALNLKECLIGMIWANGEKGLMKWNLPLWYIPMCFVQSIMARITIRYNSMIISGSALIFSFFLSNIIYQSKLITNLPFALETAIYLFPFFCVGLIIRNYYEIIFKQNKLCLILEAVFFFSAGTYIILLQNNIDYVLDEYRNYSLFFLGATCMIIFLIILIGNFSFPKIISKLVGQNTLPILLMHKFPLLFFEKIFPLTKQLYVDRRIACSFIISVLSVIICLICKELVVNVSPWLIGQSYEKNKK